MLSQDGLPLAAYPEADEAAIAALWSRLASIGPVTRGFLTVRSEVWAFVQGERHGAMVVADRAVRPGQMLDILDGVLAQAAAAEVLAGSDRRDGSGVGRGDPRAPAARRFSTPLHREGRPADQEEHPVPVTAGVVVSLEEANAPAGAMAAPAVSAAPDPAPQAPADEVQAPVAEPPAPPIAATPAPTPSTAAVAVPASAPAEAQAASVTEPHVPVTADAVAAADVPVKAPEAATAATGGSEPAGPNESPASTPEGRAGGEVDIIALAREFAGLIIERE